MLARKYALSWRPAALRWAGEQDTAAESRAGQGFVSLMGVGQLGCSEVRTGQGFVSLMDIGQLGCSQPRRFAQVRVCFTDGYNRAAEVLAASCRKSPRASLFL